MSRSGVLVVIAILAMFLIGFRIDQPMVGAAFGGGFLFGALAVAEAGGRTRRKIRP